MKKINLLSARSLAMLCILLQVTSLSSATENSTTPMLAYRLTKKLSDGAGIDATLNIRFLEGFLENEREIAEIRYSKLIHGNEYMGAYNLQFDRRGQSGSEHRLWQQVRHQFVLPNSAFESSARIEERYFSNSAKFGTRLRVLNRWIKNLPLQNQLRIGHELVYNLTDISASTQRGASQDRLIGSLNHTLPNGNRWELEYQLRYVHNPISDNSIVHQLQWMYVFVL